MVLIVGASGFIGNKLYFYFKGERINTKGTYSTKVNNISAEDRIHLDLRDQNFDEVLKLKELTHIILCHGVSRIDKCKTEQELLYKVNVLNTIRLLNSFKDLNGDITPIYFSTSMVYKGDKKNANELDELVPATQYGRQKLEVEQFIENQFKKYIILRLTKVFGVEKGDKTLFTLWLDTLIRNEQIHAASDISISPVYVMDVIKVLKRLMIGNHFGIYNLGGNSAGSIYNFAKRLAEFFHFDSQLIRKVSINDFQFEEPRPKYNGVDSTKAKKTTDIHLISYEESFDLVNRSYNILHKIKSIA